MLEDWEPLEYDRHIDLMEAATVKAAQDSCSEVRVVGRSMFAAYAATQSTRAHALLKRQIPSLQGMLNQGMLQYVPRECACSEILHAEADANTAGRMTAACNLQFFSTPVLPCPYGILQPMLPEQRLLCWMLYTAMARA